MSDSVGSVSVEVVPDARGWSEKLNSQIRDTTAKVKVDADTTEADAKLDEVAHTRTAKIKTDTSQLSRGAKSLDDFVGKLGLLPALAITAGAALIPLAAAAGGLVAALGAPIAIAAGGGTLFAFLGGLAVKETQKQLKNVDQLKKSVESARTSLENAQRSAGKNAATSASVANAQERLAKATKAYQTALGGLTPAQKQFADSLGKLKGAFGGLLAGKNGQALLGPINTGMDLLAKLLPLVEPLLRSVSGAFSTLLGDLSSAAGGQGFKQFVDQVARLAAPDIVSLGHILGNVAAGAGGLVIQFNKHLSGSLLDDIDRFSGQFAHFGETAGKTHALQSFFDYFHRVGPQVASTFASVAKALERIVQALAPLGPPVLHIIQGIADAISGIPVGTLTALAKAAAEVVVFQKLGGFKATSFIAKRVTGGQGIAGGLIGAEAVQKVFVVNMPPGGLGGGGGGTPPIVKGGEAAAAEESAAAAAGKSGILAKFLSSLAGDGALKGAARFAGYGLESPAFLALDNEHGNEQTFVPHTPQDFAQQYAGRKTLPNLSVPELQGIYGINSTDQARSLLNIPELKSTGTALQAILGVQQRVSRGFDVIGHSAAANSSSADHSLGGVLAELGRFHAVSIPVIAQTANAIHSLEALQAYRIKDKDFTVYQHNQIIERAVGPGGGRGNSNPGGSGLGGGSSSGGAGRTSVHVHLDDSGRHTLSGFMDDNFNANYHANRAYENTAAGR